MQPLVKCALKIESLLQHLQLASAESHPMLHQHALFSCSEIINLTNKPEFKSHFLKEFIRIMHIFDTLAPPRNSKLFEAISKHIQHLTHRAESFSFLLLKDPLIFSLHSSSVPNRKEVDYCSPKLLLWMHAPYEQRQNSFTRWMESLAPLVDLIRTYLTLLRSSSVFNHIQLQQDCYQCSIPKNGNCQLVTVPLAQEWQLIPNIQQGHQRLTVNLQNAFSTETKTLYPETIELGVCQF